MSIASNPYNCDQCGRSKGVGNRWLLGIIVDRGTSNTPDKEGIVELGLARPIFFDSVIGYAIIRWDEKLAFMFANQIEHLCSEQCALIKQSEHIR